MPFAKPPKLFAVYLGGRAPRCNTELHDVIFFVGESIETSYHQIMDKWFGNPRKLHIDSWIELTAADGYRITLQRRPSPQTKKLFFINLGAYLPGQFTEVHANAFVVAEDKDEVKKRAKSQLLRGAQAVHTDDLYELDDCLEISEVDGHHIHLEPAETTPPLDPHNAYHIIPPKIVSTYVSRRKLLS